MKNFKFLIVSLVAMLPFFTSCSYNSIVEKGESVDSQWANVESAYQRRADLIPNLVATVKGYANHEKSTLEAVINARANATKITLDASNLTEENIAKFQEAQGALTQALNRLMVVHEQYPDLKANEQFRDLQVQLEGTENRINVEREKFNGLAREYNTTIKKFPANITAMIFSFSPKSYFKAEAGAEKAPQVSFE